jgi:hypothetical protein
MRSSSMSVITMKMITGMKMKTTMITTMSMIGTKGYPEPQAGPPHHGMLCATHATATVVCSRRSSSGGQQ